MFCFSRHYPFSPGHTSVRFHPLYSMKLPRFSVLASFCWQHLPQLITHTYPSLTIMQTLPLLGSRDMLLFWLSSYLPEHLFSFSTAIPYEVGVLWSSVIGPVHFSTTLTSQVISFSLRALNSMYKPITLKFLFPFKICPPDCFIG